MSITEYLNEFKKTLNKKNLKLFNEGIQYNEMKKEIGKNWIREVKKVHIVDKIWFKKWKEYINYKLIKNIIKNKINESDEKMEINYDTKIENHPGEISNTKLIYNLKEFHNDGNIENLDNIVIRHDIDQNKNIKFINAELWEYFFTIYGGGPKIVSNIIEEKIKNSNSIRKYVELYLTVFNVCFLPKRNNLTEKEIDKILFQPVFITNKKNVTDLKERLIKIHMMNNLANESPNRTFKNSDAKYMRLWKFNSLEELKNLLKKSLKDKRPIETKIVQYIEYFDSKLEFLNCGEDDIILAEYAEDEKDFYFKIEKLVFKHGICQGCQDKNIKMLINPCPCKQVWYCSEQCKDSCYQEHQATCKKYGLEEDDLKRKENSKMGLVGLQNLGNTCFMNTSLQCISSCWELTNYFLTNLYKNDINEKNPIGTKGILARAYGNLLKNIWFGEKNVYSPWNFKRAIATFQPMFTGYQQHDTQEFLNYLLDGLHEDLNRVIDKPIVEKDESKKHDEIKSLEQWYGFLLRNQSVLVDLLYGQFKSTLYCPKETCQNISTTFDPFLSISLSLTNKVEPYEIKCFFIFYDILISPIEMLIPFSQECTIMAFRNKISNILNVHPFSFFIAKMDSEGNFDHLLASGSLLKINNSHLNNETNQKPLFMFQIDPQLFYNISENKFFAKDSNLFKLQNFKNTFSYLDSNSEASRKLFTEDYEENELGGTEENSETYYAKLNITKSNKEQVLGVMKINTDDNHGFSNDYIRVVLHLTTYNLDKNNQRERVIFPRIIYVKLDWTCEQLHYILFDYFISIFNKKKENPEILWKKLFSNFDASSENDNYEFHKKSNYPYRIRISNKKKDKINHCVFCLDNNCDGCLLPFNSDTLIKDLISKYPRNDVGNKIDNTYLYLAEFQRKFHKNWDRDFSLELCWLPEYKKSVHNLNEKVEYDFKLEKSQIKTGISIYNCLKNFMKLEKLEDMNEWFCPECKTHQKATKKMEIFKSPHILIIQLKRFKNLSKIDCFVDYPIVDLDLNQFVISNEDKLNLHYDLFAVANHVGNTGFGHYYSYAKNPFTGLWYKFDDSNVSPLPYKDIVSPNAYVLFYRRRNLEHIIDLGEIYRKSFINFESQRKDVEININLLNNLNFNE